MNIPGAPPPAIPELREIPDRELIECLVTHGMPRNSANELRTLPQARFHAIRFWADVQNAARGDKAARARVEYCRSEWHDMTRSGVLRPTGRLL